jgi:biotin carboxylase
LKRVLLVATTTGYQIRSFGEAAERLGIRLAFASDRCDQLDDPWFDRAIPVRFHEEGLSVAAIASALAEAPIDGVLAVGDRPAVLAARVAERFGLPGNPPAAAQASRNKLRSRQAYRSGGLLTPSFDLVHMGDDERELAASVKYPAVIKPLALSASRGVIRVDDPEHFVSAFRRLRQLLKSPDVRIERDAAHDQVMIESFIRGREFALEGVLVNGVLQTLAIFDKPDPLDGPFFEETIYLTPSEAPASAQQTITETVAAAAQTLGLNHGPLHAECRVNNEGVYVLETAARPIGGLCSRALRFVATDRTPASLEEILLRHATGEDISGYRREEQASGVMMIPIPRRGIYKCVEGVDEAEAVPGIEEVRVTAKPDTVLVPLPEGKSYLGFLFARADESSAVEGALREAHRRLRFVIEREIALA